MSHLPRREGSSWVTRFLVFSMSSSLVTSKCSAVSRSLHVVLKLLSPSRLKQAAKTLNPSRSSRIAISRPNPESQPVIRTYFPSPLVIAVREVLNQIQANTLTNTVTSAAGSTVPASGNTPLIGFSVAFLSDTNPAFTPATDSRLQSELHCPRDASHFYACAASNGPTTLFTCGDV